MVNTKKIPNAMTIVRGSNEMLAGSGGGSNVNALSAGSRLGATYADQHDAEHPEQQADRLQAAEARDAAHGRGRRSQS